MDEHLRALSFAFWEAIINDLKAKDEETRLWLDTGKEPTGFLWWCEVTDKNPPRWRNDLVRLYQRG